MSEPLASGPAGVAVAAVAARYRLALRQRRHRGRLGARRGAGSGGSQEFHDFRDYAPGDDLRHVDWAGYARTEQLRVRLFEAEVAPWWDVVVDTSASMAVTPAKAAATRDLLAAFTALARGEQAGCRVHALGGGPVDASRLVFAGGDEELRAPAFALRPGGVRMLLTDGLWRESPAPLLHALAATASHFVCVQLLDPWEQAPKVGEVLQLVDCETGAHAERRLDRATVAAYLAGLERLTESLAATVTGGDGVFARVVADDLDVMFARDLLPAAVVEPA